MPALKSIDFAHIDLKVAALFSDLGKESFYSTILDFLRCQVQFDSAAVLLYRLGDKPQLIFDGGMHPKDRSAMQEKYFDGAYLLSPFYLFWNQNKKKPTWAHLDDITPESFFSSVYYTDYYARSGIGDEGAYILPVNDDSAILLSLGRMQGMGGFQPEESHYLRAVLNTLQAATQKHISLQALPPRLYLRPSLEEGVQLFGCSVLTDREQGVVQLMLRGHSSKSCARLLGISPATERVHRRHIYSKLGISTQAALFHLFFRAMEQEICGIGKDPYQLLIDNSEK